MTRFLRNSSAGKGATWFDGSESMTVMNDSFSEAADGVLEPRLSQGPIIMLEPPSCSAGTLSASTARFTSTVRFGDNKLDGIWEYALGTSLGQYGWCGTTGVAFNSGVVALDMTVELAGGQSIATLSVGSGQPISLTGLPFTKIDSVGVRAEVTRLPEQNITLRTEWSSLDITFFDEMDNGYSYPGLAVQRCPMPFYAETLPMPSFGTIGQSRIILPGSVQGAVYPARMTLNGTFQFTSSAAPQLINANQLVVKVYIWAS
jgi:hypothetical protein